MSAIKRIKALGFPWETQDPFLFCAHHRDEYPAGNLEMGPDPAHLKDRNLGQDFILKDGWRMYHGQKMPGFPVHPHRGFETITINKEGVVDHSDSLGAAGRFAAGDVQWMTAGKGIQHSEMFPLLNQDRPNPLEIFQVWLNLPRTNKFVDPHFKMLWREEIPVLSITDEKGHTTTIEIIAGAVDGKKALAPTPDSWAAQEVNAVRVLTVKMEEGAKWVLSSCPAQTKRTIYFYRGSSIEIASQKIDKDHLIELEAEQEISIKNGSETGFLLVLEGKPMGEPVAQYGPFVMNTEQEIHQAIEDYRRTEFGGWPWPEREPYHMQKSRFAIHANGTEEIR